MPQGFISEPQLSDSDPVNTGYRSLVDVASGYLSKEGLSRLEQAFHFGRNAHEGQKRDSGIAYFTHPLAVATLLAPYCMIRSRIVMSAWKHWPRNSAQMWLNWLMG
jgi:(p)ppGpp synthase/HD superfamily hydrolase